MQSYRVPTHARVEIHWTPQQKDWLKWNLDGSVRGQSGCAANGGVLRDLSGRWISGFARNVGQASVTLAELWAFKDAIQISISRGYTYVWLESDSATTVNFYQAWHSKSSSLFWLGFHYPL
ncbi:Ribonuclease H-like superfamily [Sesbania bispinosa]|nr:Ribonuclease H-like superfamily [Sesbania bispinosa]